jgi:hypothetical protein
MYVCVCRGEELEAQPLFYNDATPMTVESLTGLWSDLKATVEALSEVRSAVIAMDAFAVSFRRAACRNMHTVYCG